jgi:hypothetical protein
VEASKWLQKVQSFKINYKLNDGTLINLYAGSVTELESGLADLAMNAMNIRATGLELSGGQAAASTNSCSSCSAVQCNTSCNS